MSKHKETGIKGEQIAVNFLLNNNYAILHTNWRHGNKEVDIIAQKDDMLVFVEVKTRTGIALGYPEESVTLKKQNFLKFAAENYLEANPTQLIPRYDVISIILKGGDIKEIVHFKDAFY